jgi:hypothetical protein
MEKAQLYFSIIISGLFFIIGLFGNVISIIIFDNKEFKTQPITVYLKCTCFMNIITIMYLPIMIMPTIWTINENTCKIMGGLMIFIIEVQAWIVALCSFDRLITVLVPYRFLFKNKLKFQLGSIATMIIILFILIIPFIFSYNLVIDAKNETICSFPIDQESIWVMNYFKVQFFLFRAALPFTIMFISSIVIVWKMCTNKSKLIRNTNHKREIQLAKSLVVMDFFFITLRLPVVFTVLLKTNDDYRIMYNYVYSIFTSISTMNNVFLFILFIVCNKLYHDLFFKYMGCKSNKIANLGPNRVLKSSGLNKIMTSASVKR